MKETEIEPRSREDAETQAGDRAGEQQAPVKAIGPHQRRVAIWRAILKERARQEELVMAGMLPFSCADVMQPVGATFPVLVEEIGEVGKAVQEFQAYEDETGELINNLETELIQSAAVCVAMLEAIAANKGGAQ